jgi:signal transduction histidine kinase
LSRSATSGSEELARLVARQETLLSFIESISGELALRPLLTRILRAACELIGADHGTIGLVDEKRGVVRTEAIFNMPSDELGAEMAPGVGIAGRVLMTGEPLVLNRYGNIETPSRVDMLENPVIGMPISWHGRMIGFFGIGVHAGRFLATGRPLRQFRNKDLESLAVFARHAAIAIMNARRYEWEQHRTERLRLIARIGRIITSSLRQRELLQAAADAIHELLGYPNVAIPLIESGDPDVLVLSVTGGHYRHLIRDEFRIPVTRGIMGAAARTGETVLVNDVASDPRHLPTPGATGIRAELAVPIRLGGRVVGVLNVESPDTFSDDDAASLEIVADQLAVGIDNARLYERGQRLAVLEERQRLARDLHDSVTQQIFAMKLIAETLASACRRDPDEAVRRSERLTELTTTALAEMRALVAELRPDDALASSPAPSGIAMLRQKGLVAAIRRHAGEVAADAVEVDVEADSYSPQSRESEEALYRIAQEALSNAVRHAGATRITMRLSTDSSAVRLRVRDDGCGFDPHAVERREDDDGSDGGYGLTSMRERAHALGGVLDVRSSHGRGTVVEVAIPVRTETRS